MDQCKDELIDMEKELVHLRRDSHSKAIQLSHLEMALDQKHAELHMKTRQGRHLTVLFCDVKVPLSADISRRLYYLALSYYYKNKNTYLKRSLIIQQLSDVYD